jgi:peptidoglycan biosynthesis protein MviN/MurJ (putative lipid II flippase)
LVRDPAVGGAARFNVHDNHRRIAKGALWMGLFVLVAKLCVAAKEMAIAWSYGVGATVDAYQLAYTLTTWLPMMLGAVGTAVLVPPLVALAGQPGTRPSFIGELNAWTMLLGAAATVLTIVVGPSIANVMTGAFNNSTQRLVDDMVWQLSPLAYLMIVGNYLAIRLQALGRYVYSLWEAVPPVCIALLVLALPASRFGGAPLIWGTLAGALLGTVWLWRWTASSDGGFGGASLGRTSREWPPIYAALAMTAFGQLFMGLAIPVDQAFAAHLGEGSVATLGYANRIIGLGTSIGTLVIARAMLPVLSEVAARGEWSLGYSQALRWAIAMLFIGAVAAMIGWALAPWAVAVLFERGAFTAADSAAVTEVLRYGLLQLPVYFGGIVFVQWLAAARRYDLMLWNTILSTIAKFGFNVLLIGSLGVAGLTLASALMYVVALLLVWAFSFVASRRTVASA